MTEDSYAQLRGEPAERGWRRAMALDTPAPQAEPGSFADLTTTVVFGDVWNRPGLSSRDRRLLTLAVIADAGRADIAPIHVGAALRSGDLTPDELEEVVVHLAFYAGWPRTAAFHGVVRREIEAWREARDPEA